MGVSRCGTYLFVTYKKIRCAIYSGQLSAGEKIPSVREMAKKREDTAKVLCFSYFDNMFALGFSKDEAENIRSEDAGETKDQASGSKFIKFYGKSRQQSICFFLLCGYRKPRRLSDEQREQARLRMEKINSDDNCRED